MIIGEKLDDGRDATEGCKYRNASKYNKRIMTEEEFERFCKVKFCDPRFSLDQIIPLLKERIDIAPDKEND